jgi:hypothetical protein
MEEEGEKASSLLDSQRKLACRVAIDFASSMSLLTLHTDSHGRKCTSIKSIY